MFLSAFILKQIKTEPHTKLPICFPFMCLNTLNDLLASAITWYKDGRPLTSAAGLRMLKRGQVLEIERAQLSDAGMYRCVAVNLAGIAEVSLNLQVYGE